MTGPDLHVGFDLTKQGQLACPSPRKPCLSDCAFPPKKRKCCCHAWPNTFRSRKTLEAGRAELEEPPYSASQDQPPNDR